MKKCWQFPKFFRHLPYVALHVTSCQGLINHSFYQMSMREISQLWYDHLYTCMEIGTLKVECLLEECNVVLFQGSNQDISMQ